MTTYKTPFSKRCEILGHLWVFYREDAARDQGWTDFFDWADIALPLAHMISFGIADLSASNPEQGTKNIDDAWAVFCELIDIDSNANYESIDDCFSASPNSPLKIDS